MSLSLKCNIHFFFVCTYVRVHEPTSSILKMYIILNKNDKIMKRKLPEHI